MQHVQWDHFYYIMGHVPTAECGERCGRGEVRGEVGREVGRGDVGEVWGMGYGRGEVWEGIRKFW